MSGIYHLEDVAAHCGVTVEAVRGWIDRGLRAFPLGHSTKYEPRDYLIREEWLYAFLDAHSAVRPKGKPEAPPTPEPARPKGRGASPKKAGRRAKPSILGPCPV